MRRKKKKLTFKTPLLLTQLEIYSIMKKLSKLAHFDWYFIFNHVV